MHGRQELDNLPSDIVTADYIPVCEIGILPQYYETCAIIFSKSAQQLPFLLTRHPIPAASGPQLLIRWINLSHLDREVICKLTKLFLSQVRRQTQIDDHHQTGKAERVRFPKFSGSHSR